MAAVYSYGPDLGRFKPMVVSGEPQRVNDSKSASTQLALSIWCDEMLLVFLLPSKAMDL